MIGSVFSSSASKVTSELKTKSKASIVHQDMNANSLRSQSHRGRRYLPHVHRSSRIRPVASTFFPSYTGAVAWIRRNQRVIEMVTGLLEMYPSLIQEIALDAFWEFIAPFVNSYMEKKLHLHPVQLPVQGRRILPSRSGRLTSSRNHDRRVPMISVTQESNDLDFGDGSLLKGLHHREDTAKSARVYLCCREDSKLYSLVLQTLLHDSYVKRGPSSTEGDSLHAHMEMLREVDAFAFVLDDMNLNTLACFKDLCAAKILHLPMIFIKDPRYVLPTLLPEAILHCNLHVSESLMLTSRTNTPSQQERGVSLVGCPNKGKKCLKDRSLPSMPRSLSAQSSIARKSTKRGRKEEVRHGDPDMLLTLITGYREALVFEEDKEGEFGNIMRRKLLALFNRSTGSDTPNDGRQEQAITTPGFSAAHSLDSPDTLSSRSAEETFSRQDSGHFLTVPDISLGICATSDDNFRNTSVDHDYFDSENESVFSLSLDGTASNFSFRTNSCTRSLPDSSWGDDGDHLRSCSPHLISNSAFNNSTSARTKSSQLATASCRDSIAGIQRSDSRRLSFTHLHQLQQNLVSFFSHTSSGSDCQADRLEEQETTYMVCNKSNNSIEGEPRLVKWPPTSEVDFETNESETMSESSCGFKDVDLSIALNRPNDTPDSDVFLIS